MALATLTSSNLQVQRFMRQRASLMQTALQGNPLSVLTQCGTIFESPEETVSAIQGLSKKDNNGCVQAQIPWSPKINSFGVSHTQSGTTSSVGYRVESVTVNTNMYRLPVNYPTADNYETQRAPQIFSKEANIEDNVMDRQVTHLYEMMGYGAIAQLSAWAPATTASVVLNDYTIPANDTYKFSLVQGFNSVDTPDSTRLVRPSAITDDVSLTTSHLMSASFLVQLLEQIRTSTTPLEPLKLGGFTGYGILMHPFAARDLLSTVSTTQLNYPQLQQAWISSGLELDPTKSITQARVGGVQCLGAFQNELLLFTSPYVLQGVSNAGAIVTTARRNILFGANALAYHSPYGVMTSNAVNKLISILKTNFSGDRHGVGAKGIINASLPPIRFGEELIDHGMYKSIDARSIWGFKRVKATNSVDNGVLIAPTYAA